MLTFNVHSTLVTIKEAPNAHILYKFGRRHSQQIATAAMFGILCEMPHLLNECSAAYLYMCTHQATVVCNKPNI